MIKKSIQTNIDAFERFGHPMIMDRFIVRNGLEVAGSVFTGERGERKLCFMNATHMSLEEGIDYYEGFAVRPDIGMPIHHAWCMVDGKIIDPTWDRPEECSYLGVHIPKDDLREVMLETGVYGVLDYGMINVKYIVKRDPEMREIIKRITGHTV